MSLLIRQTAVVLTTAVLTMFCSSSLVTQSLPDPLAETSYFGCPILLPYSQCCANNSSWQQQQQQQQEPQKLAVSFHFSHMLKHNSSTFYGYQVAGFNSTSHLSYRFDPQAIRDTLTVKLIESDDVENGPTSLWFNCCNQSLIAFLSYLSPSDTMASSIGVYKGIDFVSVFSLLPFARVHVTATAVVSRSEVDGSGLMSTGYMFYVPRQNKGLALNFESFVLYTLLGGEALVNVTIKSTVNLVGLKNGGEVLYLNETATLSMEQLDVIWFEPHVESCNSSADLNGTIVLSTAPIAVFSGLGKCNESGEFSYDAHVTMQLPPTHNWGVQFLLDLTHLQLVPTATAAANLVFSIASDSVDNAVQFSWFRGSTSVATSSSELKTGGWLSIEREYKDFTHVFMRATAPILVLYEAISKEAGDVIFSMILQPIEWFANQQSIPLIGPPLSQKNTANTTFVISLIVQNSHFNPQEIQITQRDATGLVLTNLLEDYHNVIQTEIEGYTVSTFEVATSSIMADDKVLLVNHTERCAKMGASVFSINRETRYANSNGFVLDDSPLTEGIDCTPTATTSYIIIGSSLGATLLAATAIFSALLLLVWRCALCKLPEPPPTDGFEYDVLISFAEESQQFAEHSLKAPLEKQGYSVFWPEDDYIVGLPLNDNITRAVKISRQIVYILDDASLHSDACQKELSAGLESHDKAFKGRYRRLVTIVVEKGACPEHLKRFRAVKASKSNVEPQEIRKLIKKLKLGKPLSDCQQQKRGGRRRRLRGEAKEDTLELLAPHN